MPAEYALLYSTLAGSASIFVGIVTALLVNRLSSIRNRREKLKDQFSKITNNLDSIIQQRKNYEGEIDAIEDEWNERAREAAESDISDFAEELYDNEPGNFDRPIENEDLEELFKEFLDDQVGEAEINRHHKELISERKEDLIELISVRPEPTGIWDSLLGGSFIMPISSDIASMDYQRSLQERREHYHAKMRYYRSKSREQFLENEKARIESELSSLDSSEIYSALKVNALTITLCVIVPVAVYLNQSAMFMKLPEPATITATSILWVTGLGVVFGSMYRRTASL